MSKGLTINHMSSHPANSGYPDATAIVLDKSNFKVTVVYNDHSVYIWDVRDINKVGKSHSFLFHSACIWGLEMYPSSDPAQVWPLHCGAKLYAVLPDCKNIQAGILKKS